MFIYHFSRLIKSKLLWAFLALLMVFAFVVMDSCSGPTNTYSAAYLQDEPIDYTTVEEASKVASILRENSRWYLPQKNQIFAAVMNNGESSDAAWKLIAARAAAEKLNLSTDLAGAEQVLAETFANNGVFSMQYYLGFLAQCGYPVDQARLFEKAFNNVWLPAQSVTSVLFNSIGWASPMEVDFAVSALHDKTTVYAATLKNQLDASTISITDEELTAWYNSHQDDYKLPEQRVIAYVEVMPDAYAKDIVVNEIDAMQYYDDHGDEFKGTGTNANRTLPFEEVKDQAIAKKKAERALEKALADATERLVDQVKEGVFAEAAKAYGEVKQATLRADRPIGFQNARNVIDAAFEMDLDITPVNAISGTDRVYLIRLEKIIPAHVAPFAEVKDRVQTAVRQDAFEKRLKTNGETIRGLLAAELAKGTAFDQAVAACKVDGLTATTAMTFVVSDAAAEEIPYRTEIMPELASLGTKALSGPLLTADKELVLVYVADRQPGDTLVASTAKFEVGTELTRGTAFQVTADWLDWNLKQNPPLSAEGTPILQEAVADDEE